MGGSVKRNIMLSCVVVCFVSIFCVGYGQNFPSTAPSDNISKVINTALLYRAVGSVNSPVYLDDFEDVKVTYCWYETRFAFGEEMRTSEKPYYTEECTYKNGRLFFYRKGERYYRINWHTNGKIKDIIEYDFDGDEVKRTSEQSLKLSWESFKLLKAPGHGLASSRDIYISSVVLDVNVNWKEYKELGGYYLRYMSTGGARLMHKSVSCTFGKIRGQLAKGWTVQKDEHECAYVYDDGRLKIEGRSDFKEYKSYNRIRYESIVEY